MLSMNAASRCCVILTYWRPPCDEGFFISRETNLPDYDSAGQGRCISRASYLDRTTCIRDKTPRSSPGPIRCSGTMRSSTMLVPPTPHQHPSNCLLFVHMRAGTRARSLYVCDFQFCHLGCSVQVLLGEVPVALAAVECSGTETSLLDCPSNDDLIRRCGVPGTKLSDATVLACADSAGVSLLQLPYALRDACSAVRSSMP